METPVQYFAVVRNARWALHLVAVTSEAHGKYWGRDLTSASAVCGSVKSIAARHSDRWEALEAFRATKKAIGSGKDIVGRSWRDYQRKIRETDRKIFIAARGPIIFWIQSKCE